LSAIFARENNITWGFEGKVTRNVNENSQEQGKKQKDAKKKKKKKKKNKKEKKKKKKNKTVKKKKAALGSGGGTSAILVRRNIYCRFRQNFRGHTRPSISQKNLPGISVLFGLGVAQGTVTHAATGGSR